MYGVIELANGILYQVLNDDNIFEIETQYFENKFKYKRSLGGSIDNIATYLIKHEDLKIEEMIDK